MNKHISYLMNFTKTEIVWMKSLQKPSEGCASVLETSVNRDRTKDINALISHSQQKGELLEKKMH